MLPDIDDLIAAGPDPDSARPRLQRFVEQGGRIPDDGADRTLLAGLFGSGSYLSDMVLADTAGFASLCADPFLRMEKRTERFIHEVEATTHGAADLADLQRRLRRHARREMLRLGARQLHADATLQVARELSHLADAVLRSALAACTSLMNDGYGLPAGAEGPGGEPPSLVVLAMGKLGGEELNFSSDIDLVYFYSTDDGHAGSLSLHEYFARLSRLLTQAISDTTDDGFVFRVDLRLRPEGRSGAICNSIAAAERYYETFGRTWERQALLRARPAAGDLALGRRLLATLEPFVFPRSLDRAAIDDVLALRRLFAQTAADTAFNVKLSPGGIRDIELVAQLLQLVHGGGRPDLRVRGTLPALQHLALAGLLADREKRVLGDAYRFMRRLEHLIQIEQGAQTHALPDDEAALHCFARRMDFAGLADLRAAVLAHRREVIAIGATLGEPEGGPSALVLRLMDPARDRAEMKSDLRSAGFSRIEDSLDALDRARARMPDEWLAEAIASPDPDRALGRLCDIAHGGSAGLFQMLRQSPQLVRMLANLFGTSDRLSRYLIGNPNAWQSLLGGLPDPRPAAESSRGELPRRLHGLDEESAMREMRRYKTEQLLRIGLHDVAGTLGAEEVSGQLADIAEACVRACVLQVTAALASRYGVPDTELTVLGLGSVGAREMRYGSDLDLVFLFAGGGATARNVDHQEWFARLAQRMIGSLGAWLEEGRLYEVDARLRPSGAQGLLVTSYRAFAEYHEAQAAPWERAALLRARPLLSMNLATGNASDGFTAPLHDIAYGTAIDRDTLRVELARIRQRIEEERAGTDAHSIHLRLSRGGLTDCEFVAAFAQLSLGRAEPRLQTTSPFEALAALAADVAPGDDRFGAPAIDAALLDHYRFLRRVGLRLRLMREGQDERLRPEDHLPLSRTIDLPEAVLMEKIAAAMAHIRAVHDRIFA